LKENHLSNFHDLGLSQEVLRAIDTEGYRIATPIQVQAIPEVLAGRDLMGSARTGTGKTAAFAIPTLERLKDIRRAPLRDTGRGRQQHPAAPRPIRALVLAPTRELAAQISRSFNAYGRYTALKNTVVFGGVGQGPQVQAIRSGVDILVATPGRLEDLMEQRVVSLRAVEILILDEADHMLDIGFIHALKRIVKTVPTKRQTLMFSATMPREIRELAREWLKDPVHVQVDPVSTPAADVAQSLYYVEKHEKPHLLASVLAGLPGSRSLAFTRTKYGADKVVKFLSRAGFLAAAIHGNKSQDQRHRALARFKSGRVSVLVATDIAARGLDIDGITHVFNLDLPQVAEVYVHRIGRTGRAGAAGTAISFCAGDERPQLRAIENLTRRKIRVEGVPAAFQPGEPPLEANVPTRVASKPGRARERMKPKGDVPCRSQLHQSKSAAENEPRKNAGRKRRGGRRSGKPLQKTPGRWKPRRSAARAKGRLPPGS
jgi:ATP-dependent RNA helicase RhlE